MISAFWSRPVKWSAVSSAPVWTGESSSLKLSAIAAVMSSGLTVAWAAERAFRRGKIEAFSEAAIAAGGGERGGGREGLWGCGRAAAVV